MRTPPRTPAAATLVGLLLLTGPASAGNGIAYPRKVAFGALPVARTKTVDTWATPPSAAAMLTVKGFFKGGDSLTVTCARRRRRLQDGKGKSTLTVHLARGQHALVTFDGVPDLGMAAFLPAHVCDFDANGWQDLKFVFYLGGCAGHSNTGQVYYLFQHEREWSVVSFFVRDCSYTWECDLDGDGKFELLKGHHQDKTKPGYHDRKTDRWVGQVFRKYLFINAYALRKDGLALSNHLSGRFPRILPFRDDPFDVARDKAFLDYNQFKLPHQYHFERKPTLNQPVGRARPGPRQDRSTAPA
jgi:hypothetical protein